MYLCEWEVLTCQCFPKFEFKHIKEKGSSKALHRLQVYITYDDVLFN